MFLKIHLGVRVDRLFQADCLRELRHSGDNTSESFESFLAALYYVESANLRHSNLGAIWGTLGIFFPILVGEGHRLFHPRTRLCTFRHITKQPDQVIKRLTGDTIVATGFCDFESLQIGLLGRFKFFFSLQHVAPEVVCLVDHRGIRVNIDHTFKFFQGPFGLLLGIMRVCTIIKCERSI